MLRRSVFAPLPDEGTWGTAVLLDGNIGIGGDPVALVDRIGTVLRPDGTILVEIEAAGAGLCARSGRFQTPTGVSERFRWGRLGLDGLEALHAATGFATADAWHAAGRWFAELKRD